MKQLSLFVIDEASAIQWLRRELTAKPRTAQELTPVFMRELQSWAKHEQTVELRDLLQSNFLEYDGVPPVPSQIHRYLSTNFKELRNLSKDDPDLIAKAKGRWYVPDPSKALDLEKLREKALLREFEDYKASKDEQAQDCSAPKRCASASRPPTTRRTTTPSSASPTSCPRPSSKRMRSC